MENSIEGNIICPYCHKQKNNKYICGYCNLSSGYFIMLTGPALSMKTILSNYLHRRLRMPLVESAYLGYALNSDGNTDEKYRFVRRERLKKIVESHLIQNIPVIIDGAFHRERDRNTFISHFQKNYPFFDIIVVWCMSDDETIRSIRRIDRNDHRWELETHQLSENEAKRLLAEFEPPQTLIEGNIPIIKFDSDSFKVKLINSNIEGELYLRSKEIVSIIEYGIYTGKL